jgi:hypothetical protein
VDITYEKDKDGDTEFVGSFRHGADNDVKKVIITCGPRCILLASAPKLKKRMEANIGASRGGRPSNACANNPGDDQGKVKCLAIRYLDWCNNLVLNFVDFSVGCDATCWKCKLIIFTCLCNLVLRK